MHYLIAFGITFFGLMIGIVMAYHVERSETATAKLLGSSISILVGAGLLMIFSQGELIDEHWFYPPAILVGFIFGTSMELLGGRYPLFPSPTASNIIRRDPLSVNIERTKAPKRDVLP